MIRNLLRRAKHTVKGVAALHTIPTLNERIEYLNREVTRLAAAERRVAWRERRGNTLGTQTKASFDYQWAHLPTGRALPSDPDFMRGLEAHICEITRLPREWFVGKKVVDVGCGLGRYSYGLLKLGALVTAADQSEAALARTAELCAAFAGQLTLKRIDLLAWDEAADYDLAFSFGVVHHTGNTYLATENVCRKVGPGGRLFLMIYGVPETYAALVEVNEYERLAAELRDRSFEQRQLVLQQRFGPDRAHGWFDAVSPRLNDRLTLEEIHDLLSELGFACIDHTVRARNHHVVAARATPRR